MFVSSDPSLCWIWLDWVLKWPPPLYGRHPGVLCVWIGESLKLCAENAWVMLQFTDYHYLLMLHCKREREKKCERNWGGEKGACFQVELSPFLFTSVCLLTTLTKHCNILCGLTNVLKFDTFCIVCWTMTCNIQVSANQLPFFFFNVEKDNVNIFQLLLVDCFFHAKRVIFSFWFF